MKYNGKWVEKISVTRVLFLYSLRPMLLDRHTKKNTTSDEKWRTDEIIKNDAILSVNINSIGRDVNPTRNLWVDLNNPVKLVG